MHIPEGPLPAPCANLYSDWSPSLAMISTLCGRHEMMR